MDDYDDHLALPKRVAHKNPRLPTAALGVQILDEGSATTHSRIKGGTECEFTIRLGYLDECGMQTALTYSEIERLSAKLPATA